MPAPAPCRHPIDSQGRSAEAAANIFTSSGASVGDTIMVV